MATECPDCSRWFKGNDCSCGYQVKRISRQPESNDMCLAHGCPLVGSLSDSTRPPHRYFCRHHFGTPLDQWQQITREIRERGEKAQTVAEINAEHFKKGREYLEMMGNINQAIDGLFTAAPGREWAYRLKARHDSGEKLLPVQIKSYREALSRREAK